MAILYQVGSISFEPYPMALMTYTRTATADFAAKDLLGTLKNREAVGEGDTKLSFSGCITPYHFGGLENLDVLDAMRVAQDPFPVMRGDGAYLGWFVLEEVEETHEAILDEGVGQKIGVRISITKVPDPSADAQNSSLLSLF